MTQHNAALVEQTNAAIEQTEAEANRLDTIVEIFKVDGVVNAKRTVQIAPSAAPVEPPERPVQRSRAVYLSQGSAALEADWNEF